MLLFSYIEESTVVTHIHAGDKHIPPQEQINRRPVSEYSGSAPAKFEFYREGEIDDAALHGYS